MKNYTTAEKREAFRVAQLCMNAVHEQQFKRLHNPFLTKRKFELIFNLIQGIKGSIVVLESLKEELPND